MISRNMRNRINQRNYQERANRNLRTISPGNKIMNSRGGIKL